MIFGNFYFRMSGDLNIIGTCCCFNRVVTLQSKSLHFLSVRFVTGIYDWLDHVNDGLVGY